jgi:hypothetical protein
MGGQEQPVEKLERSARQRDQRTVVLAGVEMQEDVKLDAVYKQLDRGKENGGNRVESSERLAEEERSLALKGQEV